MSEVPIMTPTDDITSLLGNRPHPHACHAADIGILRERMFIEVSFAL